MKWTQRFIMTSEPKCGSTYSREQFDAEAAAHNEAFLAAGEMIAQGFAIERQSKRRYRRNGVASRELGFGGEND